MRSMDKTAPRRSLDDIEREKYKPYSLPMDTPYEEVALTRGAAVSHCPQGAIPRTGPICPGPGRTR